MYIKNQLHFFYISLDEKFLPQFVQRNGKESLLDI